MKYEFVEIELKNNVVKSSVLETHRRLISQYAEKGYKYAGYVPTQMGPSGKIVKIDLIFETE